MIRDGIENASLYMANEPLFRQAFQYLVREDLADAQPGKISLVGDDLFVNLQDNRLIPWEDGRWEAHRDSIDIQFVVRGREIIGHRNIAGMHVSEAYAPGRDVMFFSDPEGNHDEYAAGEFAVFFPQDAHRPNTLPANAREGEDAVRVAIVKIRVAALQSHP